MMSREIGVSGCEGLAAFGQGDYAQTIELLMPLRGKANRFGGSHAQRDMFSWTLTEAAIRLGDRALAQAFGVTVLIPSPTLGGATFTACFIQRKTERRTHLNAVDLYKFDGLVTGVK